MTTRRAASSGRVTGDVAVIIAFAAFAALLAVGYGSWRMALGLTGSGDPTWEAFTRPSSWPGVAVVFVALAETALLALTARTVLGRARRHEVTRRAQVMTPPRRLSEVSGASATKKARRLRPDLEVVRASDTGIELGRTVIGDIPIYASWEDELIIFGGPRTYKTAGMAISAACAAPGPLVTTSNKRDMHDHTRGVRERVGTAWVSDLQGRTGEPQQDWWWNILAGIDRLPAARRLVSYFEAETTLPDARSDNYFQGGALELAALHLLAAGVGGGDIMHAFSWLAEEESRVPAELLESAGHAIAAGKLRTVKSLNARQRDGLFDMARRLLGVLSDEQYARTVLPPQRKLFDGDLSPLGAWAPTHELPEFDPAAFVTSRDSLYLLSMEGPDSATALVTALVGTVLDQALKVAARSPGGRLPTPLVGVLDEAANVCKLTQLPALYSHLGSQGVVMLTFLQSPAQASEVWSTNQLDQLISASNCHIYAGGVEDAKYLQGWCEKIGDHDVARWADSLGRGGSSRSQSWSREPTLPVSLLAELPKDLAVVSTSGNAPVLVRKSLWWDGRYADAIGDSLRHYSPPATTKELL
ncbi:TraG/TraD/VirD4 family protein [Nocardia sp. NPDC006630]|uniref:type IV secretory system conjugative DNA transfer family protein n=1 Tax=Nocardia sp. NPDC006630 TaxID=3157181 RepID=UPI00339DACA4